MGAREVVGFLSHLASPGGVSASTQNQALSAIVFLGHRDVATTMVYTHVLNRGARGVKSPFDLLT
jgi:integrase